VKQYRLEYYIELKLKPIYINLVFPHLLRWQQGSVYGIILNDSEIAEPQRSVWCKIWDLFSTKGDYSKFCV